MDCFSTTDVYPCASFSETTTTNIIKTEKRSELRDLRGNLSKTARDGPHPPAKGASLREQSRTILLTLGRNHSGENFDIFVTAAINLMHPVSLLSPNVPENRRPLCEPLVARFPNPVWLGDHCAGPQKTGWCCELISFQSSLQHFLIPSVFFFLWILLLQTFDWAWRLQSPPSQDVFNIFYFAVSACRSEFGSLLWSDEVKSPTRLAPSLAGEFHRKGNVIFGNSNSPFSFTFFFSLQKNWIVNNLSSINLASFKISMLSKRTVSPQHFRLPPVHNKADISRELCA